MFITENQNIGDSVLFLLSARTTLTNIIEQSGTENANKLISFIVNEASDYQVIHLLLNGTLPKKKYNVVAEMILFSDLKESMLVNQDFVTEIVGQDIFDNILNEVDSLYMQTSTARPVLELAMNQDIDVALSCLIGEVTILSEEDSGKFTRMVAKLKDLKDAIGKAVGPAKEKAKAAYDLAKKKLKGLQSKPESPIGKAKTAVKKFAIKPGGGMTKAGMATGGAATAAMAIYAGAKIYKRFLSQAAKSCAGQSGAAKTLCMGKYKKQAIMKQAAAIQSASASCAKSKDPAKCKAGVAKKVQSLKAKAAQIAA